MFSSAFSPRKFIAVIALSTLSLATPMLSAAAQAAGKWVHLGTERVGTRPDKDIVYVGRDEGRFEKLMLKVTGGDVHVGDVKVVYGNGTSEHLNVQEYLRAGQSSPAFDLRGHHRMIERIELIYQSERPRHYQTSVHVYGQTSDAVTYPYPKPYPQPYPQPYPPSGNWDVLGTQSVGFAVDHDTIRVGMDKGRYRTLKLKVSDHDIFVYNARVTFMNGTVQELPIKGLIRGGTTSTELDLEGERRMIERVDLVYRTRPGFHGFAHVAVLGKH